MARHDHNSFDPQVTRDPTERVVRQVFREAVVREFETQVPGSRIDLDLYKATGLVIERGRFTKREVSEFLPGLKEPKP